MDSEYFMSETIGLVEDIIEISSNTIETAEEVIVSLMMMSPKGIERFRNDLGYLPNPKRYSDAKELIEALDSGYIPEDFWNEQEYNDETMTAMIAFVKMSTLAKEAMAYKENIENVTSIKNRNLFLDGYADCVCSIIGLLPEARRIAKRVKTLS